MLGWEERKVDYTCRTHEAVAYICTSDNVQLLDKRRRTLVSGGIDESRAQVKLRLVFLLP